MNMIINILGVLTLAAGITYGQGSLTPSASPSPVMKTLDQMEPRTPISSLPYTITNSGSYYLTGNLTSTADGIIVQTNDVTLDFMGFSIEGDLDGGDNGFEASGGVVSRLVVRNGSIRHFQIGLYLAQVADASFEHLVVNSNTFTGFALSGSGAGCNRIAISDSSIAQNGNTGIKFDASSGKCSGNSIRNSFIGGNAAKGVSFEASPGACNGNKVIDCMIVGNNTAGITLYSAGASAQCNGNGIEHCVISENQSYGVDISAGPGGTCDGNQIIDCVINQNQITGVSLFTVTNECSGSIIRNCSVTKNGNVGISLNGANGNRIENNNCFGHVFTGIGTATCSNNFILRNTCVGQADNFLLSAGDTYGPIVTNSGALASSGDDAHPWANFSR